MNTFSKIAILLLSLAILAIPASAALEGDQVDLKKSDSTNQTTDQISGHNITHELVPEHAEIRPFFRDSDPLLYESTSEDGTNLDKSTRPPRSDDNTTREEHLEHIDLSGDNTTREQKPELLTESDDGTTTHHTHKSGPRTNSETVAADQEV